MNMCMKISTFLKRSFFIVFSVLIVPNLFAGVIIIRKDDGPKPPIGTYSVNEWIPVSAFEDGMNLALSFEDTVGNATVTVYDSMGQIVYSNFINTDQQNVEMIDISNWSASNYTITITYGTTHLSGEFMLE